MFNNLLEIVAGPSELSKNHIVAIKDILNKMLAEATPRMLGVTFDITEALINNYHESIHDSLFILFKLILRTSTKDICKQNQISNKLGNVLAGFQKNFSVVQQFNLRFGLLF